MWNILNYNGCTSFEYGRARRGRLGEWVGHPTQKPTKLVRHLVKICSNEGDIILDPFNGSGTTTLIAKQLQRKYIGIELEEKYIDVAIKRLSQETLLPLDVNTKEDGFPPTPKGMGIQPTIL